MGFLQLSATVSIYLNRQPPSGGSVPCLSGHANAHRCRSLARVRRHKASRIQVRSLGILPLSATASIYLYRQPRSGQSRVYQGTQLRTDGVHCRESVGTRPVGLKLVPVTGTVFSVITMDQFLYASRFPRPSRLVVTFQATSAELVVRFLTQSGFDSCFRSGERENVEQVKSNLWLTRCESAKLASR